MFNHQNILQVFQHQTMITNVNPNYRYIQDFAFVFELNVILHILMLSIERYQNFDTNILGMSFL